MYERKRDTIPNPGHDLAACLFFWLNPKKNKIVAEGARWWVIFVIARRTKQSKCNEAIQTYRHCENRVEIRGK